jgi:homoserine/homoserine lactone efflux protein
MRREGWSDDHEHRTLHRLSPDHDRAHHHAGPDCDPHHLEAHADLLFEALRWTGAAYLIWLGVQAWRNSGEGDARLTETGRARFARGILVALSNPKTIVFFTAFLPQFLDPKLPAGPQLAVMCVVTVILAGVSDCAWAVAAGMGRAWFMKPKRVKLLGRLSGTVLIGGGLWLSLARRTS